VPSRWPSTAQAALGFVVLIEAEALEGLVDVEANIWSRCGCSELRLLRSGKRGNCRQDLSAKLLHRVLCFLSLQIRSIVAEQAGQRLERSTADTSACDLKRQISRQRFSDGRCRDAEHIGRGHAHPVSVASSNTAMQLAIPACRPPSIVVCRIGMVPGAL
jgi:hypothetical protein